MIIQAPRGTVADLTPYRPAFDITGADIYPVSYPPGIARGAREHGHQRRRRRDAEDGRRRPGAKPVWMTLQIAWSGVDPAPTDPDVVPRFPTLPEERFMAYQAIVERRARAHLLRRAPDAGDAPDDAALGWNWTFWERVLRPLVAELASPDVAPGARRAERRGHVVSVGAQDVELVTRRTRQVPLRDRRAAGRRDEPRRLLAASRAGTTAADRERRGAVRVRAGAAAAADRRRPAGVPQDRRSADGGFRRLVRPARRARLSLPTMSGGRVPGADEESVELSGTRRSSAYCHGLRLA